MQCPYCLSDVPEEAAVCRYCHRDLYLLKPLMTKVSALEAEVRELRQKCGETAGTPDDESAVAMPAELLPLSTASLSAAMVAMMLMLVAAHVLLLFVYNANDVYLRVASMLIPVPFGLAHGQRDANGRILAFCGLIAAGVAVFGMLCVTAYADNVPVLPTTVRDIRETFEYVLSIGLAYSTGLLLGRLLRRRPVPAPGYILRSLAALFARDYEGSFGIERVARRLQRILSTVAPIVTAAASVYAGIKALSGG